MRVTIFESAPPEGGLAHQHGSQICNMCATPYTRKWNYSKGFGGLNPTRAMVQNAKSQTECCSTPGSISTLESGMMPQAGEEGCR
jgi:hypothetical protein